MTIEMNYNFSDCVHFNEKRKVFVFRNGAEMTIAELVESSTYVEVDYIWTKQDIDRAHGERNFLRNLIRDYVSSKLDAMPTPVESGDLKAEIAFTSKVNDRVGAVRKAQALVGPNRF